MGAMQCTYKKYLQSTYYALTMYLQCAYKVLTMYLQCTYKVLTMYLQCTAVLAIYFQWVHHVICDTFNSITKNIKIFRV